MNSSEYPGTGKPQIPGYTIHSVIGHGGCATVYRAQQHNLQRDVALKVMNPILTHDPDVCARFLREAQDTAALSDHPNIVTVHDVGHANNMYYIAMQYISGPSLKQLIDTTSKLPAVETLLYQLAEVLYYIHEKGFIHRDIKPANILFNASGEPVLSDFGVARLTTHTSHLTQVGAIVGTAKYMSPEQCRGDSQIDATSDLYSLGIVLFEILTGRAPFESTDSMVLMLKHLNDPIPLLPAHASGYQPLVNKLLDKQVEHRYQNAAALMKSIEQLLPREQVSDDIARSGNHQTNRFLLENDTRTSTVLGVAVVLLIGIFGLLIFLTTQSGDVFLTADRQCPELSQIQRGQRDALIELALMHTEVGRLIHPPGANAHEAFSLALDIDPCNQMAKNAIDDIVQHQ